MNKLSTIEVTAYPINSRVWIIECNKLIKLRIIKITLHSIRDITKVCKYTLATANGVEDYNPKEVFPTRGSLVESL